MTFCSGDRAAGSKEIADVRGGEADEVSLIVNMVGMTKAHEVGKGQIKEALDFEPSSSIAFLPDVFVGMDAETQKILVHKEGVEILKTAVLSALKAGLAPEKDDLDETDEKKSGIFGGLLTKLTAK